MICNDIQSLYLDRDFELPDIDIAVRIAEHMDHCETCRHAAGQYDTLRQMMKPSDEDIPEHELPPLDLERKLPVEIKIVQPVPSKANRRYRIIRPLTQVAVVLLAVIGWGFYISARQHQPPSGSQVVGPRPPKNDNPAEQTKDASTTAGSVMLADLHWTHAEVVHGAALFNKVSESFDGHAAWVAVGDGTSDVGLIKGDMRLPPKVLLVRLSMGLADNLPSKTDLFIVPGQEVSMQLPFQNGEVLCYRIKTTVGQQPRLTLAAEVRSEDHGETLAALTTQLQPQAGQALSAGNLLSQSGRYCLDVSFSETAISSVQ